MPLRPAASPGFFTQLEFRHKYALDLGLQEHKSNIYFKSQGTPNPSFAPLAQY